MTTDREWVDVVLRQMDISSNHLLEQHRRLQQEIYVRLRSRLTLLNYAIGATGGIAGIVSFVFPRKTITTSFTPDDMTAFAIIAAICFTGAFVYLFFFLNFLSHSGYIYAASRQIHEEFPATFAKIEAVCCGLYDKLGAPPEFGKDSLASDLFSWEGYITKVRAKVKFTDSKFEILAFTCLSISSFTLSFFSFLEFVSLLLTRTGAFAIAIALVSGVTFTVGSLLYILALMKCRSMYMDTMCFRDSPFKAGG